MSGGVDSSVAALLMKEKGYTCMGATMKLYQNEDVGLRHEHTSLTWRRAGYGALTCRRCGRRIALTVSKRCYRC